MVKSIVCDGLFLLHNLTYPVELLNMGQELGTFFAF